MKVALMPGKYVVAVSGGVDSMVLLDVLAQLPDVGLVVAHFDHGIREDSDLDRRLVERAAQQYDLPFVFERGNLGPDASEATARAARYDFLRRVGQEHAAAAIITAHHQDDLIETAILNVLRGTGRKGLSSLQSGQPARAGAGSDIIRPFLHLTKQQLYEYAGHPDRRASIIWNVDSTNANDRYVRNYIRHHIMPQLGAHGRQMLLRYIQRAQATNPAIDMILLHDIGEHTHDGALDRRWFAALPHDVSREVMAAWLRANDIREFDKKMIERLTVGAKTSSPGRKLDVQAGHWLEVGKTTLGLR